MDQTAIRRFHKLSLVTLIAVYFLIAVGSIVRTTGSGMGCPDWPKCFGSFVPPTSIDQLPTDYKEKYAALREKKNARFVKYLRAFGFNETADKIANDKSILVESDFNPVKTWIEYINRLVGVLVGFLILFLAFRTFRLRKVDPMLFRVGLVTVAVLLFQGWFGSIVVSTNLTTWTITVHMVLALIIVMFLVYLYQRTGTRMAYASEVPNWLVLACMAALFAQVFLGTEVRAGIDCVSAMLPRGQWIEQAGSVFLVHRSFSWIVLILHLFLILKIQKTAGWNALSLGLIVLILGSLFSGIGMAYFEVPAVLQPTHLLLATITLGTEVMLIFGKGTGIVSEQRAV